MRNKVVGAIMALGIFALPACGSDIDDNERVYIICEDDDECEEDDD